MKTSKNKTKKILSHWEENLKECALLEVFISAEFVEIVKYKLVVLVT